MSLRADCKYWLLCVQGTCVYCTCPDSTDACYGATLAEAANSLIADTEPPGDRCSDTASGGGSGPRRAKGADRIRSASAKLMDPYDEDILSTEAYARCNNDVDWVPSAASPLLEEAQIHARTGVSGKKSTKLDKWVM